MYLCMEKTLKYYFIRILKLKHIKNVIFKRALSV